MFLLRRTKQSLLYHPWCTAISWRSWGAVGVNVKGTNGADTGRRCNGVALVPRQRCLSYYQGPKDRGSMIKTEKILVQEVNGQLWRWIGVGSTMQLYSSMILGGYMVVVADASVPMLQTLSFSGALVSLSAAIFFGARMMNNSIVTDIHVFQKLGSKAEYINVQVAGMTDKNSFLIQAQDLRNVQRLAKSPIVSFTVGSREYQIDTSRSHVVDEKAFQRFLDGKKVLKN